MSTRVRRAWRSRLTHSPVTGATRFGVAHPLTGQGCLNNPVCLGEGGFKVESVLIRCWLAGPRLPAVPASLLPSPVLDVAVVSDSVGATVDSNL